MLCFVFDLCFVFVFVCYSAAVAVVRVQKVKQVRSTLRHDRHQLQNQKQQNAKHANTRAHATIQKASVQKPRSKPKVSPVALLAP